MLRAQGNKIVDVQGRPVTLRGVNLGGWLVEEVWMQPFVTKPPAGSSDAPDPGPCEPLEYGRKAPRAGRQDARADRVPQRVDQ